MIESREKINKNLPHNDLPQHLAIMIDGNRRWAKARHLPSWFGHRAGIKRVIEIINYAKKKGIKVLTLYGFSTENWNRSKEEVNSLMELFSTFAKKYASQFKKKGIQFRHLGNIKDLPKQLQRNIQKACELTRDSKEMILNIALNYGGRDEITRAVQKIIQKRIPAKKITEQLIMANLDTKGLPDVDFIVRTSGEMRLSNFLPLQGTYAELYFPKVYWPDFDAHQFDLTLEEFKKRQRKFGK
jgi:undecaprenyl diphosphate synthase